MAEKLPDVPVEHRLTPEDLDREVRTNWPLLHIIAGKWHRRNRRIPYDDVFAAACLGFVEAVRLFDVRRGIKFSTYARWWSENRIRDLIHEEDQRLGPLRRRFPREKFIPGEADARARPLPYVNYETSYAHGRETDGLLDSFPDPTTVGDEPDRRRPDSDLWERVRSVLPPREYEAVRQSFHDRLTYRQIGDRLGVSSERIRQLINQAVRRLQRRLVPDPLTE